MIFGLFGQNEYLTIRSDVFGEEAGGEGGLVAIESLLTQKRAGSFNSLVFKSLPKFTSSIKKAYMPPRHKLQPFFWDLKGVGGIWTP